MSSSEVYRKKFEEMRLTEEKARDLYAYEIERIKDPALLEKLKEIYEDEKKHVQITSNFIDLLSK